MKTLQSAHVAVTDSDLSCVSGGNAGAIFQAVAAPFNVWEGVVTTMALDNNVSAGSELLKQQRERRSGLDAIRDSNRLMTESLDSFEQALIAKYGEETIQQMIADRTA